MISIRSLRSLRAIRVSPLTSVRFYSIDEFNKNKKNYSFGLDLDNLSKQHLSKDDKLDLNSTLESHPDLVGLDQNSPEYKDTLYALHQSQQLNARAEQKRYESRERMKAVFYGFSAMIGIVAVHQLFMNYEYFKNWLTHESTYGKELDSKVKSLDDPSMNENNMNNLISRYTDDLDNANVINSLQGLSVPGLYLFGGNDNKKSKFPLRIPFFNDKILRDVQLKGDLLVAVSEKGNDLFELIINQKQNKQGAVATTKLPFRVTKAQISGDYVYLLSERGDLYYKVRSDRGDALFSGYQYRNYLGISRTSSTFGHIKISSKLADLKAGESHLLLLAKDGKLLFQALLPLAQTAVNTVYQCFLHSVVPPHQLIPPLN